MTDSKRCNTGNLGSSAARQESEPVRRVSAISFKRPASTTLSLSHRLHSHWNPYSTTRLLCLLSFGCRRSMYDNVSSSPSPTSRNVRTSTLSAAPSALSDSLDDSWTLKPCAGKGSLGSRYATQLGAHEWLKWEPLKHRQHACCPEMCWKSIELSWATRAMRSMHAGVLRHLP